MHALSCKWLCLCMFQTCLHICMSCHKHLTQTHVSQNCPYMLCRNVCHLISIWRIMSQPTLGKKHGQYYPTIRSWSGNSVTLSISMKLAKLTIKASDARQISKVITNSRVCMQHTVLLSNNNAGTNLQICSHAKRQRFAITVLGLPISPVIFNL